MVRERTYRKKRKSMIIDKTTFSYRDIVSIGSLVTRVYIDTL